MIKPRATIQPATIEFVIGKPKTRTISTACCDSPCSTSFPIGGDPTCSAACGTIGDRSSAPAPTANTNSAPRPRYTIKSNGRNDDEKKLVAVYMSSFPGFYGDEGETTAIARSKVPVHNHV